jgi:hypothetical protein
MGQRKSVVAEREESCAYGPAHKAPRLGCSQSGSRADGPRGHMRSDSYGEGTANLGLEYCGNRKDADINNPDHTLGLAAYSDSAYGNNTERKSTAGYVIFMAGGVISFKSYWQRLVTLSSTESEYIAMTYAAKEISWLQRLLGQVGYIGHDLCPFHLQTDNKPALNMIRKDGQHKRTKHIDVYYKYTTHQYKEGHVTLSHCPGMDMPADGLTKPLNKLLHTRF